MKKFSFIDNELLMNMKAYSSDNIASELAKKVATETEKTILQQLNDFISRGLIEVEITQPVFVQDKSTNTVTYKSAVNLKLKDRDYILKLEEKVKLLEELVEKFKNL